MRYSDTGRLLAGVNKPVFASEKKKLRLIGRVYMKVDFCPKVF